MLVQSRSPSGQSKKYKLNSASLHVLLGVASVSSRSQAFLPSSFFEPPPPPLLLTRKHFEDFFTGLKPPF